MNELGGHPYFLIKFFFFYYEKQFKFKSSSNHGYCILYHKYFVVTLKLTNYADNTSLKSLLASLFVIFRGNSYIGAKYRQSTGLPCNGLLRKNIAGQP